MIDALSPTPPGRPADRSAEVAALEAKLTKLEQEKRRAERLLLLTRRMVKRGRLTVPGVGRPSSTRSGGPPSTSSTRPKAPDAGTSTPTKAGEGAR